MLAFNAWLGVSPVGRGEVKIAKEIAGQLNLSPKNVSVHRDQIKGKPKFQTSPEMIHRYIA